MIVNVKSLYNAPNIQDSFDYSHAFESVVADIFTKGCNSVNIVRDHPKGLNYEFDFKLNGVSFEIKAQSTESLHVEREKKTDKPGALKDSCSKYYVNFNPGKWNSKGANPSYVMKCRVIRTDYLREYILKNLHKLSPESSENRYFVYINPKDLGDHNHYVGFCPLVGRPGEEGVSFDMSEFKLIKDNFEIFADEIRKAFSPTIA